jgi:mono/diheme cytochrome c family protein
MRALVLYAAIFLAAPAAAQQPPAAGSGPQHPGREVLMGKCFQCHTDAMWRDHRAERRGWEAAIHRMIGRGGLWTAEEIKLMADYLGTDFGPNAPRASPPAR